MEKVGCPVVEFDDFSCGYRKGEPVVSGVSLELPAGSFSAIVGPNGAGKSSLLRSLAQLMPWSSGEASIFGRSVSSYASRELSRSVAFVSSKAPSLSVLVADYVMLGRTPFRSIFSVADSRADRVLADDAISAVGISSLKYAPMSMLSDGQRQMAGLARAIAQQPKLLLLDEPTSNLDPRNAVRVLSAVRGLCDKYGLTAVAVIHDINAAIHWTDFAVVMSKGHVSFSGAVRDVLTPSNMSAAFETPFVMADALLPSPDYHA
ncbi:MAG: ABC transporter ATP-binding protein [Marinilabiliaceae bacterium]